MNNEGYMKRFMAILFIFSLIAQPDDIPPRSDFAQLVFLSKPKPSKKDKTETDTGEHLKRLLVMMLAYHEMKSSYTATGLKSCSGKKNGE